FLPVAGEIWSGPLQVGLDTVEGDLIERQTALAIAAADHSDASIRHINIVDVNHHQLANTHASGAEQPQHGVIPLSLGRVAGLAEAEQRAYMVVFDSARQRLFDFG